MSHYLKVVYLLTCRDMYSLLQSEVSPQQDQYTADIIDDLIYDLKEERESGAKSADYPKDQNVSICWRKNTVICMNLVQKCLFGLVI